MSVPVTADWMFNRLDTPGLTSGRMSRSLSVMAERIFLADNAGSSSRLDEPASACPPICLS